MIALSDSYLSSNAFQSRYNSEPDVSVSAPARVNLIGEHTDYNEGFVLPAALSFYTRVCLSVRTDNQIRAISSSFSNDLVQFALTEVHQVGDGHWSKYLRGVIQCFVEDFSLQTGFDIYITSDVPQGAGLSSSASLCVALVRAISEALDIELSGERAARLAQRVENEFVGCACGIMDQLASALCKKNHGMHLDCRDLSTVHVLIPQTLELIIIHSNVRRGLVESEYNARRAQCFSAARKLGVSSLRKVSIEQLGYAREVLSDIEYRRVKHVVTENARTHQFADALASGNVLEIGRLMKASHRSMRDDFDITVEAVDQLVEIVEDSLQGLGGVRMTGGGFGGCVVVLCPLEQTEKVINDVALSYQRLTGIKETVFTPDFAEGAFAADAQR